MKNRIGWRRLIRAAVCPALCAVLLVPAFLFAGCGENTEQGKTAEIVSPDGSVACEAPAGWQNAEGQLNSEAVLEAANTETEEYLVVLTELRSDFDPDLNLQGYNKIVVDNILGAAQDTQVISEEKTEFNGNAAFLTKISAAVEDTEITYWIVTEEWPEHYVQAAAWTLTENADKTETEILSLIRSVKRMKSGGETPDAEQ